MSTGWIKPVLGLAASQVVIHWQIIIQQSLTCLLIQASTPVFQQFSLTKPKSLWLSTSSWLLPPITQRISPFSQVFYNGIGPYTSLPPSSLYKSSLLKLVRFCIAWEPFIASSYIYFFYCFCRHGPKLLFAKIATPILYAYWCIPTKVL